MDEEGSYFEGTNTPYYIAFGVLAAACAGVVYKSQASSTMQTTSASA